MARTVKNKNIIGNNKSNKWFKQTANRKMRKHNNNIIAVENFDNGLINSLKEISNFWTSAKEWKQYATK